MRFEKPRDEKMRDEKLRTKKCPTKMWRTKIGPDTGSLNSITGLGASVVEKRWGGGSSPGAGRCCWILLLKVEDRDLDIARAILPLGVHKLGELNYICLTSS